MRLSDGGISVNEFYSFTRERVQINDKMIKFYIEHSDLKTRTRSTKDRELTKIDVVNKLASVAR